jgi:hypothetical protein
MENETTKVPQTIIRPGHGAARHISPPAIRHNHGNLFAPEIFPTKLDLHRHAIQRERAFDRQRNG